MLAAPKETGGSPRACRRSQYNLGPFVDPPAQLVALTTISLSTDFTPRMPLASFPTRSFSASESASPDTMTTPSLVVTLVLMALVERCVRSAYLTCDVMEASSMVSPIVDSGEEDSLTTRSLVIDFTPETS